MNLLQKWKPIVYLHSKERYMPCSADWLISNSVLFDYSKSNNGISPVTNKLLYDTAKSYGFKRNDDNSLILSFNEDVYFGQNPVSKVPCYGYVSKFGDKTYLRYVFLYAKNGEYDILGLREAGDHPGDIESIVLELDSNLELVRAFYGAHTSNVCRWVDKKDIEFENGKIVVYSALNGHGLYPKEGAAFRLYGLANDYLDKGIKWEPEVIEFFQYDDNRFVPETMGWTTYWGRIGGKYNGDSSGIMGIPDKEYNLNPSDIKSSDLNPPPILSKNYFNNILMAKGFLSLVLSYFIIYFILVLVKKVSGSKDFTILNHFITIILVFILYNSMKKIVGNVIDNYAPH